MPSAGTAAQPSPKGLEAISSVVEDDEEEELELLVIEAEGDAAVSESELPQAARLRGRARPRTAMVLRRASRMMWLLVSVTF
ncbi:hypothetical protein GCM10009867_26810 [Pedococcus aerophilus]|uniref:Uncharacterized protein n=1 Tax=Pedococcus aerophilus TaxID=436356 RepID=A0ABN3US67_9MICO